MVKSGKESELWTPDMMSDEEKHDDHYIRHPPSYYRSSALSKFITKLDARCDKKMFSHPRVTRQIGSPRKLMHHHTQKKSGQ